MRSRIRVITYVLLVLSSLVNIWVLSQNKQEVAVAEPEEIQYTPIYVGERPGVRS